MTDRELSLLASAARFDGAEGISFGLQAVALILDRLVDATVDNRPRAKIQATPAA